MKEGFADYKPEEAMSEAEAEETPEAAPEEVKPTKFFTRWQTADVILNRDPHTIFQTFDYAPIMPPELETAFKYNYVSIQTLDGRNITWDKDGSVIVDDEVKKMIFWPCPTLADAVHHRDHNRKPTLFKFNSDSSVVAKAYGYTYYFGPSVEGKPAVGHELPNGHPCYNPDGWSYGYEYCYCLEDKYEREFYDSEDDMYERCEDCRARHGDRHQCRS
jgi:hypothetical protein